MLATVNKSRDDQLLFLVRNAAFARRSGIAQPYLTDSVWDLVKIWSGSDSDVVVVLFLVPDMCDTYSQKAYTLSI